MRQENSKRFFTKHNHQTQTPKTTQPKKQTTYLKSLPCKKEDT